jgi:erythromycin esterase-like protein
MADNVRWTLAQRPGTSRMVVWAHNAHVATAPYSRARRATMGAYLKRTFEDDVAVFGFAFDSGSFRARDAAGDDQPAEHVAEPMPARSLDGVLAAAGPPVFVLPLRAASGDVRAWLDSRLGHRAVGARFDSGDPSRHLLRIRPRRCFDVIVFVKHTTAAAGLATGRREGQA